MIAVTVIAIILMLGASLTLFIYYKMKEQQWMAAEAEWKKKEEAWKKREAELLQKAGEKPAP